MKQEILCGLNAFLMVSSSHLAYNCIILLFSGRSWALRLRQRINDVHKGTCAALEWCKIFCWAVLTTGPVKSGERCSRDRFDLSRAPCGIPGCKSRPAPFLARCTRQLNQALSVVSLNLGFLWVCVLCCYLTIQGRRFTA